MASNTKFQNPDFGGGTDHKDGNQAQPMSMDDAYLRPGADMQTSQEKVTPESEQESHPSRNASVATAVEEQSSGTDTNDMDKIETAPTNNNHDSQHQTHSLVENVKTATDAAKRKLYIHHRHKKDTAGKEVSSSGVGKHTTGKADRDPEALEEVDTTQAPTVWQNFRIMFTTFPYWNMAFWSGWCYSIGSAMFVVDGAWSWSPVAYPESEFEGETKYGVPLLFFFGACLYQIGGVMAYLEAVNDGSFAGAAMKRLLEGHQDIEKELLDAKLHTFFGHLVPHHHHDDELEKEKTREESAVDPTAGWDSLTKSHSERDPNEVYAEAKEKVERRGGVDEGPKEGQVRQYMRWRWWPTWHALRTYHIFELGYVACAIQLFGVTLYGVTSIVILPGILSSLEWWQELAAYWIPQVVASCCFLIASIMFTIMAQDKWYKPKVNAVSWWIGIHAQIGSVGFL